MWMSSNIRTVILANNAREGNIIVETAPEDVNFLASSDSDTFIFSEYQIVNNTDTILHPLLLAITHSMIIGDEISNVPTEEIKKTLSDDEFNNLKKTENLSACSICMENKKLNIELKCNHIFCRGCIKKWLTEKSNTCPTCRCEI